MTRSRFTLLVLVVLVALGVPAALATRTSPQTNPSITTTETFSAVAATDGFCVQATNVVANAWASAPARVTANNGLIRFLTVCHADDTDTDIDVCVRASAASTGLTCARDSGTAGLMTQNGRCVNIVLARDSAFAAPALWVLAASGAVDVCIDVGY